MMVRLYGSVFAFIAIASVVNAQEARDMPVHARKELNRLVGTWKGSIKAGDQDIEAKLTARWSESKDALVWHWEAPLISTTDDAGKFVVKGTGLLGWDASAKGLRELSFNNLSETISREYVIAGDGKWVGKQFGTYRSDDMTEHVAMKGEVSITFSGDSFEYKESSDYGGELFRNLSFTMKRHD